jgi:phosphate starvation-inducible membrane PsiE
MDGKETTEQAAWRSLVDRTGNTLVEGFHLAGLFVIGAATVWAAAGAFLVMVKKGGATVEDLLLLFIYLEIGAMVGIYFKTNHMPVRFLIYVAITATTRHLVGFVNTHPKVDTELLIMAAAILILAISVLLLRYASHHFPSEATTAAGDGRAERN